MASDARKDYISKTRFEIIVDDFALLSVGSSSGVLDQVARIKPILEYIQQVRIELRISTTSSHLPLPEDSLQRKFLQQLITALRSLRGLTSMDIVLALPRGHCRWSYDYILLFYDLEIFTTWRAWYQRFGMSTMMVTNNDIKEMDFKYAGIMKKRLEEEEKKKKKSEVVVRVHYSDVKPVDIPHKVFKKSD
jgi:hypothetical protein